MYLSNSNKHFERLKKIGERFFCLDMFDWRTKPLPCDTSKPDRTFLDVWLNYTQELCIVGKQRSARLTDNEKPIFSSDFVRCPKKWGAFVKVKIAVVELSFYSTKKYSDFIGHVSFL